MKSCFRWWKREQVKLRLFISKFQAPSIDSWASEVQVGRPHSHSQQKTVQTCLWVYMNRNSWKLLNQPVNVSMSPNLFDQFFNSLRLKEQEHIWVPDEEHTLPKHTREEPSGLPPRWTGEWWSLQIKTRQRIKRCFEPPPTPSLWVPPSPPAPQPCLDSITYLFNITKSSGTNRNNNNKKIWLHYFLNAENKVVRFKNENNAPRHSQEGWMDGWIDIVCPNMSL